MSSIHTTRQALESSMPFVSGRVLDAGGGPSAKYRSLIQSKADKYVCLDAQSGGHVDVIGDVLQMPFQDESFDTVICNQVMEHVSMPAKLISESYRVLKPGGHFICTAPFLEPVHSDPGDFFRYTKEGLVSLCASQGFKIVRSQAYGGLFIVLYSFIKFKWFSPYRKLSRTRRKISRTVQNIFIFLDTLIKPIIVYSDVLVIAQK